MEIIHQLYKELHAQIGRTHLREILALRSETTQKEDGSYVTTGDLLVQKIIIETAKRFLDNPLVVSEEIAADARESANDQFVIVIDPIDGTVEEGFLEIATEDFRNSLDFH